MVGQHPLGEAVHHEHLRRQLLSVHDAGQEPHGVVDVGRVERADPPAREPAELHRELGVEGEVDVGPLEVLDQVRQLVGYRAVADLHVEEYDPAALLCPAQHLFDRLVGMAQPVLAAGARLSLGDGGDQVQCRHHPA